MHKRSKTPWALLSLIAVVLSSTVGCGSTAEEATETGTVQFVGSVPQGLAGDEVTRVTVTLTATGVPTSTTTLSLSNGTWSGSLYQIPAGSNRTFTAEAFTAEGELRYRGQATGVSIVSGGTAVVAITLQSISTSPVFDNTVPCIDALVASSSSVLPGKTVSLQATAHDPDTGDTLAYGWTATGGTFASSATATTTWTAPQTPGSYTLTLAVTDSRGASATIRVDVTVIATEGGSAGSANVSVSFNTSPLVRGITLTRSPVPVGQSTSVTVDAADADGHPLSYQWSSTCQGTWAAANSPTATFTPSQVPAGEACGNCPLKVVVTDTQGGRAEGTLRVCVGPGAGPSTPPRIVLANQSATSVAGGAAATLRVIAEDGDGSALTFNWTSSTGTLGTPTNSFTSSEVRWTAPACVFGSAAPTITAIVTNARNFSVSQTFSVSVLNGSDCGSGSAARWDATGSMLTPRYLASALLLPSGKVLVVGGTSPTMQASAELYSPDTGTWSSAGAMSVGRIFATMTLLPSGKVLVSGGSTNVSTLNESPAVDLYDPATNTWTTGAPLTFGRCWHTTTVLPSGKVLVIGGTRAPQTSNIAELYDPATNSWLPITGMTATSRVDHAAVLLPSGKVLVAGGGAAGEFYDPNTNTWAAASGLTGTSWSRAYLQSSGNVLLTSGVTLASYNPALNVQAASGTLTYGRTYPTQVRLASGSLLVTGGNEAYSVITELFDPGTNTKSLTVSMPVARYGAAGVLLPSGKVLVAGGASPSGSYFNTALLYTP